jgi:hypothetical protein
MNASALVGAERASHAELVGLASRLHARVCLLERQLARARERARAPLNHDAEPVGQRVHELLPSMHAPASSARPALLWPAAPPAVPQHESAR